MNRETVFYDGRLNNSNFEVRSDMLYMKNVTYEYLRFDVEYLLNTAYVVRLVFASIYELNCGINYGLYQAGDIIADDDVISIGCSIPHWWPHKMCPITVNCTGINTTSVCFAVKSRESARDGPNNVNCLKYIAEQPSTKSMNCATTVYNEMLTNQTRLWQIPAVRVMFAVRNITMTSTMKSSNGDPITAHMSCSADGFPEPTVNWLNVQTGDLMNQSTVTVVVRNGAEKYRCIAQNSVRNKTFTATSEITVSSHHAKAAKHETVTVYSIVGCLIILVTVISLVGNVCLYLRQRNRTLIGANLARQESEYRLDDEGSHQPLSSMSADAQYSVNVVAALAGLNDAVDTDVQPVASRTTAVTETQYPRTMLAATTGRSAAFAGNARRTEYAQLRLLANRQVQLAPYEPLRLRR